MSDIHSLITLIRQLHERIRDAVVSSCERSSLEEMSLVAREADDDTIYAIDRVSDSLLLDYFEKEVAPLMSFILIYEGLAGGQVVLPRGTSEKKAAWRIIMDPIDGTRGLMYQKRSAWILTGIAPNRGESTNLSDIEAAIQTEIPLFKQHLSDVVWGFKGRGIKAQRYNRLTGESQPLHVHPSGARTIAHGFTTVNRFFPGSRELLSAIDEEIVVGALGPVEKGRALCFEDQYVCTGGQLYELMAGHDRFIADLRPLTEKELAKQGLALGICCHPYDVCTELLAREAGVIITDVYGRPLSHRLSIHEDVAWVGYANVQIRDQIEPLLQEALRKRHLI